MFKVPSASARRALSSASSLAAMEDVNILSGIGYINFYLSHKYSPSQVVSVLDSTGYTKEFTLHARRRFPGFG